MAARIKYFDIAKGIAIICVPLGHSILIVNDSHPVGMGSMLLYGIIFTFHMPLFFVLSGYFMHPKHEFRWRRESQEMLATYAITATAVVLMNTCIAFARRTGTKAAFANWAAAAFYGAGDFSPNYLWPVPMRIGAIWFLLALFWGHLFMTWAAKHKYTPVWVAAICLIGYFSGKVFWFPLSIQSGMTATGFIYLGYLAKQYNLLDFLKRHLYYWAIPAIIWVLFAWKFTGFSIAMNSYGKYPVLDLIGSLAATLCVVGISMIIDRWIPSVGKLLALAGQYTLPLLCTHLLEDDTTPWPDAVSLAVSAVGLQAAPYLIFVLRFAVDCLLAWLLYYIPKINVLFFPSLKKQEIKQTGTTN
ncbi:acyltransferase family protein [Bifidobacterium sp. ESL0745]|uniref:acyltransferase family protein n=1 Tax=Bifidobacterium sp. ESL0745 TaxID=2983226 RepID=UPI0023F72D97|nr:acyltransferase family protein [Bifidobacterium sp. ESL0745]MDF7666168.1 acyltransferase family protein [Bifidobacterium sp. ESL0745]